MDATVYSMRISHPARTAELMLAHKGIEAERVEVPPGSQRLLMRRHGFKGGTVPGLKLDGRRVQGTREIARALEEAQPEPPLFPSDRAARDAIEVAELWGEQNYQPVPRRIFRWAVSSDSELRTTMAKTLGVPAPQLVQWTMLPLAQFYLRYEGGGETAARRDVAELPIHLDKIDGLIEEGTLGGEELNAADFQIAPSTRVLLNFPQLRPLIEGRPAGAHAMRVAPDFGREMPVKLPEEWLP
ncbi:MAG TPA: glutathione S-transferase [Solirubrobacterales bacterium]|nr:glutathione S-transferase [Solirubrobacterales bacterium]